MSATRFDIVGFAPFELDGDDPAFWRKLRDKLGDSFVLTIEGDVYEVWFKDGSDEPVVKRAEKATA